MQYRLELWFDWEQPAKGPEQKYHLHWGLASSSDNGATWTPVHKVDNNGHKTVSVTGAGSTLQIWLFDVSSQPDSNSITKVTLAFTPANSATSGNPFADAADFQNGVTGSAFTAATAGQLTVQSKPAKTAQAGWYYTKGPVALSNGDWTFTGSATMQLLTPTSASRIFSFDPEIDINM
jgi:hypothetical protein